MAVQRATDDEILAAVRDAGSVKRAAKVLGMARSSVQERLARLRNRVQGNDTELAFASERGLLGTKPVLPGFALKRTTTVLDKEGGVTREYITQGKAPGAVFEVPADHEIERISANVGPDGRSTQTWFKTRKRPSGVDIVEAMRAAFEAYRGQATLVPPPSETLSELLSTYIITDVHHGLLAWAKDAGEDYDIRIGSERLRGCMRDLVAQSPPSEEALILNLGDFFHNNDQRNVTPQSGHQLDVDSRFFKVAVTGVSLHQDLIELALQKHARVRVRVLPGNHDPQSSITLQVGLAAFYASNPRVTVELDPAEVFFTRFGATLIGACHGDKMSPERMAMSMAMLCPEDWGLSTFRWFVHGHIHHERVKEVGNVRVESFETIASKDAYAASHGYLAGQSLTSVTLHRERGEIGRHRVNVIPGKRKAAA